MILSIFSSHRSNSKYNELECNYFKTILDALADAVDYKLSSLDILNLTTQVHGAMQHKRVTKQRAEQLITDWVNNGYLLELEDEIQYGPRTIAEFRDYFVLKHAERIPSCKLCNQATFSGQACANENCKVHIHSRCAEKYFVKNKKCPTCQSAWPGIQ